MQFQLLLCNTNEHLYEHRAEFVCTHKSDVRILKVLRWVATLYACISRTINCFQVCIMYFLTFIYHCTICKLWLSSSLSLSDSERSTLICRLWWIIHRARLLQQASSFLAFFLRYVLWLCTLPWLSSWVTYSLVFNYVYYIIDHYNATQPALPSQNNKCCNCKSVAPRYKIYHNGLLVRAKFLQIRFICDFKTRVQILI